MFRPFHSFVFTHDIFCLDARAMKRFRGCVADSILVDVYSGLIVAVTTKFLKLGPTSSSHFAHEVVQRWKMQYKMEYMCCWMRALYGQQPRGKFHPFHTSISRFHSWHLSIGRQSRETNTRLRGNFHLGYCLLPNREGCLSWSFWDTLYLALGQQVAFLQLK